MAAESLPFFWLVVFPTVPFPDSEEFRMNLTDALTARSWHNEHPDSSGKGRTIDERIARATHLEWIGDAFLSLETRLDLIDKFPTISTSKLQGVLASRINNDFLTKSGAFLKPDLKVGGSGSDILADNVEMVIGALAIESLILARTFIRRLFLSVEETISLTVATSIKNTVQEFLVKAIGTSWIEVFPLPLSLRSRGVSTTTLPYVYEWEGDDSEFTCRLWSPYSLREKKLEDWNVLGSGQGSSKKESSRIAAEMAAEALGIGR